MAKKNKYIKSKVTSLALCNIINSDNDKRGVNSILESLENAQISKKSLKEIFPDMRYSSKIVLYGDGKFYYAVEVSRKGKIQSVLNTRSKEGDPVSLFLINGFYQG